MGFWIPWFRSGPNGVQIPCILKAARIETLNETSRHCSPLLLLCMLHLFSTQIQAMKLDTVDVGTRMKEGRLKERPTLKPYRIKISASSKECGFSASCLSPKELYAP